jgi:hypothetical protein
MKSVVQNISQIYLVADSTVIFHKIYIYVKNEKVRHFVPGTLEKTVCLIECDLLLVLKRCFPSGLLCILRMPI